MLSGICVCLFLMVFSKDSCCVANCGRTRGNGVALHSFPNPLKEKDRFLLWVNAVGSKISSLDHSLIYKNRYICHDHFETRYKTWTRRLSCLAVPTLLLPGVSDHRFPHPGKFPDIFKAWVEICGGQLKCPADYERYREKKICDIHFTKEDKNRYKRINALAVPSLYLTGPPPVKKKASTLYVSQKYQSSNLDQEDGSDRGGESPCPSPEVVEEPEKELKPVSCQECHAIVEGYRFQCVSCSGCVVCGSCVSLGVHPTCYVLRVPPQRPLWEVQAVLRAVRGALAMSAFADRLAEPLADYSIAQAEIKSERKDDPDDMDGSHLNTIQDQDKVIEAAIADPHQNEGPDSLVTTTPSKKTPLVLDIKPTLTGGPSAKQTTDHKSQAKPRKKWTTRKVLSRSTQALDPSILETLEPKTREKDDVESVMPSNVDVNKEKLRTYKSKSLERSFWINLPSGESLKTKPILITKVISNAPKCHQDIDLPGTSTDDSATLTDIRLGTFSGIPKITISETTDCDESQKIIPIKRPRVKPDQRKTTTTPPVPAKGTKRLRRK